MRVGLFSALAAAVLALVASACGSTSSSTTAPLATNPPETETGTATTTVTSTGSAGPTQTSGIRTVIAPLGLNLRDQPATSGNVVGSLAEGTVVTVVGSTAAGGGWYQVKGETKTGWITADPTFSTARHMTSYASSQHGFSTLYPDTWTFDDSAGPTVVFSPQSGGADRVTVTTGATPGALGAPGAPGYAVTSGQSVEVFGVTGTLRLFDRGSGTASQSTSAAATAPPGASASAGSASPPPAGQPFAPAAAHLAEILLTVNAQNAMRIDFEYADPADLAIFRDLYNSMKIDAALPTPSASAATTATST